MQTKPIYVPPLIGITGNLGLMQRPRTLHRAGNVKLPARLRIAELRNVGTEIFRFWISLWTEMGKRECRRMSMSTREAVKMPRTFSKRNILNWSLYVYSCEILQILRNSFNLCPIFANFNFIFYIKLFHLFIYSILYVLKLYNKPI